MRPFTKDKMQVLAYRLTHLLADWEEDVHDGHFVTLPTRDFGRVRIWESSSRVKRAIVAVDAGDGWPDVQCFIDATEARRVAAFLLSTADKLDNQR